MHNRENGIHELGGRRCDGARQRSMQREG